MDTATILNCACRSTCHQAPPIFRVTAQRSYLKFPSIALEAVLDLLVLWFDIWLAIPFLAILSIDIPNN